jgi:hypothetical protein
MGTTFLGVVCDENGIGGSGGYCRINVFYHVCLALGHTRSF